MGCDTVAGALNYTARSPFSEEIMITEYVGVDKYELLNFTYIEII